MKECSLSLSFSPSSSCLLSFFFFLHHLYSLAPRLLWKALRLKHTHTHAQTGPRQFQASIEPVFQPNRWQQRSFLSTSLFQHSISWVAPVYALSLFQSVSPSLFDFYSFTRLLSPQYFTSTGKHVKSCHFYFDSVLFASVQCFKLSKIGQGNTLWRSWGMRWINSSFYLLTIQNVNYYFTVVWP